ncbi:MAG TPA: phytoene desaturase family protein [Salinivirgaceae bacterium]|nr:phytoene desaturase family protein [Salinivirgaceae bacterium]
MSKNVLIVGTGLGGLSTGLRLASRGYRVTFVEKNNKPGGRLNQLSKNGFTFDTGPSFFSMPYEFEELMTDCGLSMPFRFVELEPLYTVHIRGTNQKFALYKDIDKLAEQFEPFEPEFKQKFIAYLKKCEAIYNDTVDVVIRQNFDNLFDYVTALMQVNPIHLPILLRSFWQQTKHYFRSREVRQIVSLVAFFLGRTPFDTNGVYTLLSQIEFKHTGYYNVEGGMYTIVERLVEQLQKFNVAFHFNTEIVDFERQNNRLTALIDQNGKRWEADIFVINSDAAYFRGKVFKRRKYSENHLRKMDWTMGYLTIYLGLKTKLPEVEHHNYFIGSNYEDYAKDVMKNPGTLEKPYYYVNLISKHNPNCAPEGCEAVFIVCPVPNLLFKNNWNDRDAIIKSIIDDFSERIQRNIANDIVLLEAYTPEDWKHHFNLYEGSGLGLSHSMLQIGALRPKNFDEIFNNTFYVGASTIPGAGLPMAVISSKLVCQRIYDFSNNS